MGHDDDHTSGQEPPLPGQGNGRPGQSGSEGSGETGVELRTSSAGTIGWVAAIGAAAVVAVLIVLQVPATAAVSMLGLPAFIAVLAWACYLRPRATLRTDGVLVVNILRTYDVPFARIVDIDRRLGVTLATDSGKKIAVWALPNSGRRARREGLSRGIVEEHTLSEIEQLEAAQRVWLNADSPAGVGSGVGGGDSAGGKVVTQVRALPAALCALTAVWALWGLGSSAAL